MSTTKRLCPTCGRRCVGFNLNGRCENKRYQPGLRKPRELKTESTGSYVTSDDCGSTIRPMAREE